MDELICNNCFARSTTDLDCWETTEYGALCPECAFTGDVLRVGVDTSGVAAIAELMNASKKPIRRR